METRWRSAATVPLNQTRRRISFSVRHARAFGVVLSVLGPGIPDLLALMDAGLVGRSRGGPVEHSRNMGLVAGTGANPATCGCTTWKWSSCARPKARWTR